VFQSFFMGGFECSTHRIPSGKRLDLIQATQHDRYLYADYARLQEQGIATVREGIRWHLIERSPGQYDFSSVLPFIEAAREMNMQVIWDICHFGYPDDIDIFRPQFIQRLKGLAAAFARLLKQETDSIPFLCPVNEISFFAWAGGDEGCINPFVNNRSFELKCQLVRAAIEAMDAIWDILPEARMIHTDPVIHIIADPARPEQHAIARGYSLAQYQSWDMLSGKMWTILGGEPQYLDILGVNFYPNNEWVYKGKPIWRNDPAYKPFRQILSEVYERYGRPMLIAETGAENMVRSGWLRYVSEEVQAAMDAGIPIEGICLYPIVNHPGWADDRHCHNGLWDYPDEAGEREIFAPLARELQEQRPLFELLTR